jgi:hypothetical protein
LILLAIRCCSFLDRNMISSFSISLFRLINTCMRKWLLLTILYSILEREFFFRLIKLILCILNFYLRIPGVCMKDLCVWILISYCTIVDLILLPFIVSGVIAVLNSVIVEMINLTWGFTIIVNVLMDFSKWLW